MKKKYLLKIFLVLSTSMNTSYANKLPRDGNLREACRKYVAGMYISLFDNIKKEKSFITHLNQKITQLNKNIGKTENDLKLLNQKIKSTKYDLQLTYKRDGVASKLKFMQEAIAENKELLIKTNISHSSLKENFDDKEKKIKNVFNIKKVKKNNLELIQIDFKSTCPKFRMSCPLPKLDASNLLKIFPKDQAPLACSRYATFLQNQN